jgi:hypothetical protein
LVQAPLPETTEGQCLQDALEQLCEQVHLVAVYAFGSRATEIAARVRKGPASVRHPALDVDIGVLPACGHVLALDEKVGLAIQLEDLLEVDRVDLVVLPEAKPYLVLDIVRGELLCVTDAEQEAFYQLYVLRRAADLAPHERERRRMILAGEAIEVTPGRLSAKVVIDRLSYVRRMNALIASLPLESLEAFTENQHTPASAESYLRRGLEALFDLGRHWIRDHPERIDEEL